MIAVAYLRYTVIAEVGPVCLLYPGMSKAVLNSPSTDKIMTKMKKIIPHVFTHSPSYYQLTPEALTISGKSAPSFLKFQCAGQIETFAMSIERNLIFESTGKKPQCPVRYQLACFLLRYGTRGADSMQAAHKLGIGFGTVFMYCKRVVRVLRELGLDVVTWGNDDRLQQVATHVMGQSGIPDCVGMLDGSLINIQAIVDHEMRFTGIELGWPGSVSDVTMWKKSHIWQHRHEYLRDGYPSSPYVLRPFTEPEVNGQPPAEKQRRRKFNKRLSLQRITVEHAFDMGDCPEYIPFFDSRDPDRDDENDDGTNDVDVAGYGGPVEGVEIELPAWETDEWLKEAGRRRRLAILNDLFPL
ncbi:hypothetical protein P692DRAFT_20821652 [Suillus brevipes Sb2]|nr:hypothetical protein P692DRAFT_20821652 [Suillus brevipes Sb2]